MKLWLVYRTDSIYCDEYDSAVVVANTEVEAKEYCEQDFDEGWTNAKNIKVEYLGEAKCGLQEGIICASFNAG